MHRYNPSRYKFHWDKYYSFHPANNNAYLQYTKESFIQELTGKKKYSYSVRIQHDTDKDQYLLYTFRSHKDAQKFKFLVRGLMESMQYQALKEYIPTLCKKYFKWDLHFLPN